MDWKCKRKQVLLERSEIQQKRRCLLVIYLGWYGIIWFTCPTSIRLSNHWSKNPLRWTQSRLYNHVCFFSIIKHRCIKSITFIFCFGSCNFCSKHNFWHDLTIRPNNSFIPNIWNKIYFPELNYIILSEIFDLPILWWRLCFPITVLFRCNNNRRQHRKT